MGHLCYYVVMFSSRLQHDQRGSHNHEVKRLRRTQRSQRSVELKRIGSEELRCVPIHIHVCAYEHTHIHGSCSFPSSGPLGRATPIQIPPTHRPASINRRIPTHRLLRSCNTRPDLTLMMFNSHCLLLYLLETDSAHAPPSERTIC